MSERSVDDVIYRRGQLMAQVREKMQELEVLNREIDKANALIDAWRAFFGDQVDTTKSPEFPQAVKSRNAESAPSTATPVKPKNPPKERVAEVALELIREVGRPVSRREIFSRLGSSGIQLQGADPQMVLSTMLWRMKDRIVRLPGFGYWLPDQPWEPAGFDPYGPHELVSDDGYEPSPDDQRDAQLDREADTLADSLNRERSSG